MLSKGTDQWPPASTLSPSFNVSASRGMALSSYDNDGVAGDDNGDNDEAGLPGYQHRKPEDNMLYIILGVVTGAILIGVLVALFICARQHHKQRRLLGITISLPL